MKRVSIARVAREPPAPVLALAEVLPAAGGHKTCRKSALKKVIPHP